MNDFLLTRTLLVAFASSIAVAACSSGGTSTTGSPSGTDKKKTGDDDTSTGDDDDTGDDDTSSSNLAKLGESCACEKGNGDFTFCSSTRGPCADGLTCIQTGGAKGACYGAQCCLGEDCKNGNFDDCPSGQICTVFQTAFGYCGKK